ILLFVSYFLHDTPTAELYTLSLHDALPICPEGETVNRERSGDGTGTVNVLGVIHAGAGYSVPFTGLGTVGTLALSRLCPLFGARSEEHTSELQSRENLVCRLLLEKKKNIDT